MQTIYKVFLGLFIVFIGFNIYAIDWNLGFMNEENATFVFSLAAGVIGLMFVFVLHSWSKLSLKR